MFAPILSLWWILAVPAGDLPTPEVRRDIVFIGFARNESATAWKITRRCRFADGSQDTYALVRLLDVSRQTLLASFVAAPLRHVPGRKGSPVSQATLRRRHPDYYGAASAASWRKLRRQGRFTFFAHDFSDVTVRLGADRDSALSVDGDKKNKRLKIAAKGPGPLGYTPIVRLFEGEMVPLGHFRQLAQEHQPPLTEPLRGELRVYYSHTGHLVAALNRFFGADGRPGDSDGVVMVTPQDSPIGATGVGLLQMVESQSRSLYNDFLHIHPAQKEAWRQYIGKWF